jgi:hypothetical protein
MMIRLVFQTYLKVKKNGISTYRDIGGEDLLQREIDLDSRLEWGRESVNFTRDPVGK